jgi:hypothetical protein
LNKKRTKKEWDGTKSYFFFPLNLLRIKVLFLVCIKMKLFQSVIYLIMFVCLIFCFDCYQIESNTRKINYQLRRTSNPFKMTPKAARQNLKKKIED